MKAIDDAHRRLGRPGTDERLAGGRRAESVLRGIQAEGP